MTAKEIKAKVEAELDKAPQYHFECRAFCDVFLKVFGKYFVEYELFYEGKYKTFILWYDEDTWYIYSKQWDIAICWYKHLGRINQCTNEFLKLAGLEELLKSLKAEYLEGKKNG